ncbi:hypothetical protein F5887DRAFT_51796 [Amanita rubescens]|nr:hypothetical protein F5887DRAFT_227526 [Amanita rubescens]KAF8347299.1 hypothetical protein F5887DRAFT_51796 [Amanita rubescens]
MPALKKTAKAKEATTQKVRTKTLQLTLTSRKFQTRSARVARLKDKKNKKKAKPTPREIVDMMRQTQAASGAETVKKCKALADASQNRDTKKAKVSNVHGIVPEWEKALEKCEGRTAAKAAQSSEPAKEDDDSMVQPGGLAAEDESDVEAKALVTNPSHLVLGLKKPVKKLYSNVKIEANTAQPSKSMLKSLSNGAENWLLEHLGRYTNEVVPRACKAIGSTTDDPWDSLPLSNLQAVVDEVFGKGTYNVETEPAWFGLTKNRLHNWRNAFAKEAMDAVTDLINSYRDNLESEAKLQKELRAAKVKQDIDSANVTLETAAQQLLEEGPEINVEEEIAALRDYSRIL